MKTQLQLETDYKVNGNSSGMPIDTLAIAVSGEDYNDVWDYNIDYLFEVEDSARTYWLDTEAEEYFLETLSKEEREKLAEDLDAYDRAFAEYRDGFDDVRAGDYNPVIPAEKALSEAMEKALEETEEELRHSWLHGDYRGNFEGVIPSARKKYDVDFETKNGDVYADITEAYIESLFEEENIEEKTVEAARAYLEDTISRDAYYKTKTKREESAKRKVEREKQREYRARVEAVQKESKRKKILGIE